MASQVSKPKVWRRGYGLISLALGVMVLTVILGTVSPGAARDPLLEVLIRKGVLTPQEASQVELEAKDLEKEREQKVAKEVTKSVEKNADKLVPKALKDLQIKFLGYVDYSLGERPIRDNTGRYKGQQNSYNQFDLTRAYITIQKKITPWMSARATLDRHRPGGNDYEVRFKYYYAELRPPNLGFLTDMKSEIGMGHMPWLDFEEHINPYRCQGTMAIERAGIFNSADLGVSLRGYFGGRLPESKVVIGDSHYDGLYGSWHIGVYNGASYHNRENNDNKVVEYRVTLRPLPYYRWLAGLQLSYFGLYGKGNDSINTYATLANVAPLSTNNNYFADWVTHLVMLSYQNPWVIFTGQYYAAKGGQEGRRVDPTGSALWGHGFSFFGNVRFPWWERRLNLFARFDYYDADKDNEYYPSAMYHKYIAGLAYELYKKNLLLLVFETTNYGRNIHDWPGWNGTRSYLTRPDRFNTGLDDDTRFQMVYQIYF
ncbi:MAG: hypothetical protein DRG58_02330 [Deltaproteobacteria bacterium]|nr:MAG: hypothetical protein DRG58_02330 [Deltaproteobacteria bacterium]